MADSTGTDRDAGEQFDVAIGFGFEDAEPRRLRYHLLRLTLAGLTREEVPELVELGRLAFQDSDVAEQAARIKARPDASPLAVAIADVVQRAGAGVRGPVRLKTVMLGAVLGAYASLGVSEGDRSAPAIVGAIGGAVALSTGAFIEDHIADQAWSEYLRPQES